MAGHEITHDGKDMELPEQGRCGNAELAPRAAILPSCLGFGIGDAFKNA